MNNHPVPSFPTKPFAIHLKILKKGFLKLGVPVNYHFFGGFSLVNHPEKAVPPSTYAIGASRHHRNGAGRRRQTSQPVRVTGPPVGMDMGIATPQDRTVKSFENSDELLYLFGAIGLIHLPL
jgi:hypothetical protein